MQISQFEQAKENSLAGGRRLHYFVSPNVFFDFFFFFFHSFSAESLAWKNSLFPVPSAAGSLPYLA